jgi:hypothetical protein
MFTVIAVFCVVSLAEQTSNMSKTVEEIGPVVISWFGPSRKNMRMILYDEL